MSAQHYLFAHRVLPALLWRGDPLLGILANPDNQDFLQSVWDDIPLSEAFRAFCDAQTRMSPTDDVMESMGVPREDPDVVARVTPSDGLSFGSHWLGGEHLVVLVTMPPPDRRANAHFIAITHSPKIEYLTLERSTPGETMFCKWTPERHLNFGQGSEPVADAFLRSVCRHLGVSETIEAPTWAQCQGMSKTPTVYVNPPEPLPAGEAAQVAQWEAAAEKAMSARSEPNSWWTRWRKPARKEASRAARLAEAEALYRKIRDLRMNLQGVQNTEATLAALPLAEALSSQGKHSEAVDLCREWWRQCRRFRMPGHQETHLATGQLARSLRDAGDLGSAEEMWKYRAQYFCLTRGEGSTQAASARRQLNFFEASLQRTDGASSAAGGAYDY